jgi:ketosteroid isomerase-like protein
MSSQHLEVVRSLIEAWNERGDPSFDLYHQDAEWDFSGWGFEPHGSLRGIDRIATLMDAVRSDWERVRVEPVQLREAGDRVGLYGRFYARRRGGSGLEMSDAGTCLFTFREGKIARFALVRDRGEALADLEHGAVGTGDG